MMRKKSRLPEPKVLTGKELLELMESDSILWLFRPILVDGFYDKKARAKEIISNSKKGVTTDG